MKGNDARFINHGCDPNIEVRKYQQVGDGLQEYEVGMWALKDIKQGDEVSCSMARTARRDELWPKLTVALLRLQL
jgi:SET domain-containing protein